MLPVVLKVLFLVHFPGRGVGIFVLGPLIDSIGCRWSFRIASFLALATFIFYFIAQRFLPPAKRISKANEEQNGEVKEAMQPENGEIKKPLPLNDANENIEKPDDEDEDKAKTIPSEDPWTLR